MTDYILELTKPQRIDGQERSKGYQYGPVPESTRRLHVDRLKIARVVAQVDDGRMSVAVSASVGQSDDLSTMRYNELQAYARELGLSTRGKTDEIRKRIEAHLAGGGADEEE